MDSKQAINVIIYTMSQLSSATPEAGDQDYIDVPNLNGEETDNSDDDNKNDNSNRLHVAIVGGGITGLALALGLSARGVRYTLYERASGLREIGAGIGLSPNAERALRAIDVRAHAVFKRVAAPSSSGGDWFEWVDGTTDQLAFRLSTRVSDVSGSGSNDGSGSGSGSGSGGLGEAFQGCRRSDLLEGLAKLVEPEGNVRFGKAVDRIEGWGVGEEDGDDGKVVLRFKDGTTEEADVGKQQLIMITVTTSTTIWSSCLIVIAILTMISMNSDRLRRHLLTSPTAPARGGEPGLVRRVHAEIQFPNYSAHGTSTNPLGHCSQDKNAGYVQRARGTYQ